MSAMHYTRIVRASALYDLVVTWAFMTPWTARVYVELFGRVSQALGLERPLPSLGVSEMLFANLLGSLVVVWACWRWRFPGVAAGAHDAAARVLFAGWQFYAVAHGASYLLLGFTAMEILFAAAQGLPLLRMNTRTVD